MKTYPLFDIYADETDIDSISKVIRRGTYWAVGPEIKEFEQLLQNYYKCNYAVACSNGTAALHSLLLAHGLTSGEVIVPSFTFIATANAVVLAGAKPIFAEIESQTLALDPEDVKKKITSRTKALIPVHYGGTPCKNIRELRKMTEEHNLLLIEDNAESFGAKFDNKLTGTFGDSAILSFCQNKILPTGEGGAVITNRKDIYEKLILIRSHGRVEQPNIDYFSDIHQEDYIDVGYNYRMPTICAALGISQLNKVEKLIDLRRKVANYYDVGLRGVKGIRTFPELPTNRNVYQLYSIMVEDPEKRPLLQEYLLKNGIYSKIYFAPIHLKSFYRKKYGYIDGYLPITEEISRKILSLPMSLKFTSQDQDYIINKIKSFFTSQ